MDAFKLAVEQCDFFNDADILSVGESDRIRHQSGDVLLHGNHTDSIGRCCAADPGDVFSVFAGERLVRHDLGMVGLDGLLGNRVWIFQQSPQRCEIADCLLGSGSGCRPCSCQTEIADTRGYSFNPAGVDSFSSQQQPFTEGKVLCKARR